MVTKTLLTFLSVGFGFFFMGLQYAITLPTMWVYIHEYYGATEAMLGLMMSIYSFADMICSPMLGIWTDKTREAKLVTTYCSVLNIIGNVLYFLGINQLVLVLSRFISGLGAGYGTPLLAEMSKTIPKSRLTGILAIIMISRQMGLIFGPALNILFRQINFSIGPIKVNNCNLPGLFMGILWSLYIVFITFFMTDFHKLHDEGEDLTDDQEQEELNANRDSLGNYGRNDFSVIHTTIRKEFFTVDNIRKSFAPVRKSMAPKNLNKNNAVSGNKKKFQFSSMKFEEEYDYDDEDVEPIRDKFRFKDDIFKLDIVTILLISFAGMFNQTALESILTPMSAIILKWTDKEVSFLFLGCGVELIAVFVVLKMISGMISDCSLLHVSNFLSVASLSILLVFIANCTPGDPQNIVFIILGVFLQVFSLPFLVVCSVSLYSKITNPTKQGAIQGIRRSFMAFSTLCGPIWSTSLLSHLYTNFTGTLLIFMLCEVLLIYSTTILMKKDGYVINDPTLIKSKPAESEINPHSYVMKKISIFKGEKPKDDEILSD